MLTITCPHHIPKAIATFQDIDFYTDISIHFLLSKFVTVLFKSLLFSCVTLHFYDHCICLNSFIFIFINILSNKTL